jgi:hypothetical protein
MNKIKKAAIVSTAAGMISITAFVNHTTNEIAKNTQAAQKVESTINGQCFEKELLSSCLDETQSNGLTKKEVLNLVRSSKVSIDLEMYKSWRGTVGYTYDGVNKIWMNRKFHNGFSVCESAANLAHEAVGHQNGFKHDMQATKRRPCSVPYVLGSVLTKCCI